MSKLPNEFSAFERAVAIHSAGRLHEAIVAYRDIIASNPRHAEAYCNLGVALLELEKYFEASQALESSIAIRSDIAAAHNNLGNAYTKLGRYNDAAQAYQRAVAIDSGYPEPIYNLANILVENGQLDVAIQCYQQVLAIQPDHFEATHNLGGTLRKLNQFDMAIDAFRRAITIRPDFVPTYFSLAEALRSTGEFDGAQQACQRAFDLSPNSGLTAGSLLHAMQMTADWSQWTELSHQIILSVEQDENDEGGELVDPFIFLSMPVVTTAAQQFQCAQRYARKIQRSAASSSDRNRVRIRRNAHPRLRIGYLSGDFREHAVAHAIVELFEIHDRQAFEVFAYSFGPDDQSLIRKRIVNALEHFIEVRKDSHATVAQRIEEDEIDLLVDLQGHTGETCSAVLAHRPAPIQVNFLGFPGTFGAELADYILVDEFVVPKNQKVFFSEQIVHLPGCFMVNDSRRSISEIVPTRKECGLPEDAFVFCGFGSTFKLTPEVFSVWMRLLRTNPESVLWLLDSHPTATANLIREAKDRGVSSDRLIFAKKVARRETHLARQQHADLFLDTFPYNLHSTAGDVIWLGIPLITLVGETFASRVAGSILNAVEMPELITKSLEEYEELAGALVRDRKQLLQLKQKLAGKKHLLDRYSGQPFARNIEKVFRTLVESRRDSIR
ncbi:MAG: tetratricopeptide repeat protein [Pirellulaceae bacterium]|nr:tetratricopeptide repeat protein [Pirellulaceae bacterium]